MAHLHGETTWNVVSLETYPSGDAPTPNLQPQRSSFCDSCLPSQHITQISSQSLAWSSSGFASRIQPSWSPPYLHALGGEMAASQMV